MPAHYWTELPSSAFQDDAWRDYVAVLPLGATEQHGPHLPVSTDSNIANGMVAAVADRLPDMASILFLPTLAITNSVEHTNKPGTLSLGHDLTFKLLMEVAQGVSRVGVRKLVIINAHGGNVGVMVDATHEIRAELGMLCVATNWMRLGLPDGLIAPGDKAIDIHGGRLETAIMLALRPDLVDQSEVRAFPSLQGDLADRFDLLRAYGPVGFGWMGDDLNASGAVGDASKATAKDGRAIIDHQAQLMVKLLDEVQRFAPAWFTDDRG